MTCPSDMVSSHRIQRAEREGFLAYIATGGNPWLTKNPYTKHTSQWRRYNEGWNRARKFKFLKDCT